ncbi:alkaline phosphatase family protein [Bythopirellula goksoeyrii]|nr:alkaline phosphatase family protein [Bythopirellula goksoeyrii]
MTRRLAKKVLLIGWDAADWVMVQPLLEQGYLPTLAQLIAEGTSGKLATIRPVLSPMLWNSIATGKRADKHGICGFTEPLPDGSGIRPVTSTSRKTKAVWNILSQNQLTSNVVGWFASHPAEPIRGCVVTDHYVHPTPKGKDFGSLPEGVCHPERLLRPLVNLKVNPKSLDAQAILPFVPRAAEVDASKDERLGRLASLLARTSSIHAAACAIMVKEPWDFMAVYYDAIDQFGHHFMPYHPPAMEGVSEHDAEIYKDVMIGCYRFHDMMLESLLDYAGRDTTVILVSDHGFHSGSGRQDIDGFKDPVSWHRPYGVVCVRGPEIKSNNTIYGATLLDVTPTLLSLFGLPIGDDMDGRPWLEIFDKEITPSRLPSWDDLDGDSGMHSEDRREDPVEAAEAIRQLVDLGYIDAPSDDVQKTIQNTTVDLKRNLASALSDCQRIEKAIPLWEELIELALEDSPELVSYYLELARCNMQVGRLEKCEEILNKLLEHAPNETGALMMHGQLKLQCRRPEEALDYFQRAAGISTDLKSLHSAMGQAYAQLSRWSDAKLEFQKALEADEESAVALNGLAGIAIERRQFSKAVEYALRAVGLNHHFPRAHCNLGIALAESGMDEEAIQALETTVAMAPKMRVAYKWLAELYFKDGRDPEKARGYARLAGLQDCE